MLLPKLLIGQNNLSIDGTATRYATVDALNAQRKFINYITNPSFEVNASGWLYYGDAAAAQPEDGVGGSFGVNIESYSSTALRGTKVGALSHGSGNYQGYGVAYDFDIDEGQQGSVLNVLFDYIVLSGTFLAASPGVDSVVTVWIYDKTNATLIPLSDRNLYSSSTTVAAKYAASFQAASDSTSYRLILHVGSTDSNVFLLGIDSVEVSPLNFIPGAYITGDETYTPVTQGLGTLANVNVRRHREGEYLVISGKMQVGTSASTSNVEARIGLGPGVVSDSSYSDPEYVGFVAYDGTNNQSWSALIQPNKDYFCLGYIGSGGAKSLSPPRNGDDLANNSYISFELKVKIAGWGSSLQAAFSGDDGRVIAAKYSGTASANASTSNPIQWNTAVRDEHNAVTTGSGWRFIAPISSWYDFTGLVSQSTTDTYARLYVNDVYIERLALLVNGEYSRFSGKVYLRAQQYFDIRTADSVTINGDDESMIAISRIGGNAIANVYPGIAKRAQGRWHTPAGYGSGATKIPYFTTTVENSLGSAATVVNDSTDGLKITILEPGLYDITYDDGFDGGAGNVGISLSTTQPSTNIDTLTNPSERLKSETTPGAHQFASVGITLFLNAGNIIRPHTDGGSSSSSYPTRGNFSITKIM